MRESRVVGDDCWTSQFLSNTRESVVTDEGRAKVNGDGDPDP